MATRHGKHICVTWSGHRSLVFAPFLYGWLPQLLINEKIVVRTWATFNVDDLPQGILDHVKILESAISAHACVAVITQENAERPWMMYEAGIVAGRKRPVFPILCDRITVEEFKGKGHPLSSYNMTSPTKVSVRNLVRSLNIALDLDIPDSEIIKRINTHFPEFLSRYEKAFPPNTRPADASLDQALASFLGGDLA